MDDIYCVPAYLPFVQERLTSAAARRVERELSVVLPEAYLRLMFVQNGGYLRRKICAPGLGPVDYIAGIGPKFPSLQDLARWTALLERLEEESLSCALELSRILPFFSDGHYAYCMDFRDSDEPSIVCLDVDAARVKRRVAPTFAAFLDSLVVANRRPALGVSGSATIDEVSRILETSLSLSFCDCGVETYGYRVLMSSPTAKMPRIWLSENRVRRGYARAGDAEWTAHDAYWDELVLRYPQHDWCSFILEAGLHLEEVSAVLERLGSALSVRVIEVDG